MKYSLITGSTSGIGFELAKIFAKDGHNLILTGRNRKKLDNIKKIIKEINGEIEVQDFLMDLVDKDAAKKIFDFTQENDLFVETLVNNAGFGDFGRFYQRDLKISANMIQVNITALTELTHYYSKEMVKKGGGKIMNLASIAAFFPGPSMGVYFATKAYVLSFSEAIAEELKDKNITITTLCPGATATDFFKGFGNSGSKLNPDKGMATAKDVAEFGYDHMMDGKRVVIYGWQNRMLINLVKYLPRSLVTKIFSMMR